VLKRVLSKSVKYFEKKRKKITGKQKNEMIKEAAKPTSVVPRILIDPIPRAAKGRMHSRAMSCCLEKKNRDLRNEKPENAAKKR
jgi:hypothetical protein